MFFRNNYTSIKILILGIGKIFDVSDIVPFGCIKASQSNILFLRSNITEFFMSFFIWVVHVFNVLFRFPIASWKMSWSAITTKHNKTKLHRVFMYKAYGFKLFLDPYLSYLAKGTCQLIITGMYCSERQDWLSITISRYAQRVVSRPSHDQIMSTLTAINVK